MANARLAVLRRNLERITAELGYEKCEQKITPISSGGSNFTSQLFLITISAPQKKDIKLFAKVAAVGETVRLQAPTDFFLIEQHTYTHLLKVFQELEEKHKVPAEHRLQIPTFYGYDGTHLEETLVLQDLTAEGFEAFDRIKSMDWEYASASVEELAKFHALSIAYQEKYPEEWKKSMQILKYQMPGGDVMGKFFSQVIEQSMKAVKEENIDKLQKFFGDTSTMDNFTKFYQPQRRPVLRHGDFRISNLMNRYVKENNKQQKKSSCCLIPGRASNIEPEEKLQIIMIDYQTVHAGAAAVDLLYLIFSGSDAEFRKNHYENLINHYYEYLCGSLKRLSIDPQKVFPRNLFDLELKENLPYGLILATVMLPIITVDVASAPEVGEAASIEDMAKIMENTNALHAKRINEVVEDYVRWGIL